MRGKHRSTRHHLRLIQGESMGTVVPIQRSPSPSQLASRIVRAAQEWASAALTAPIAFDMSTEEGQLLLALLDCVQDMEYHAVHTGGTIEAGPNFQLTLDMEPGTPGA